MESLRSLGEFGLIGYLRDQLPAKKGNLILNLCGEQPLLPSSACDLGSINLSKFVENKRIVYPSLRKVVHSAVRFLDNVLDVSYYPLEEIKKNCLADRRIGLGIMGFADALFLMEIPYASDEAIIRFSKSLKKGIHIDTPVFDGATEKEIVEHLTAKAKFGGMKLK